MRKPVVPDLAFYLGLALLFTHELDAMPNHEWRLLPLLKAVPDAVGEAAFTIAHVPLFAIVLGLVASLNPRIRGRARDVVCGFMVLHAALHFALSGQAAYEFSSLLSSALIYGAALCGLLFLGMKWIDRRQAAPRS